MEWFYTGEDISFEIYFIEGMTTSRKEALDKEKAVVLSKDYATKNPILALEHVEELFNLFALYMDPRNKKTDVRDILMTAKTLGLDQKYQLVFRALEEVADGRHGDPIDFETFIKDLTAKMGSPYTEEGRQAAFHLLDVNSKAELGIEELRYINEQLRYGYSEEQLHDIIANVGGFGASSITVDRWNKFIQRKVDKKKNFNA